VIRVYVIASSPALRAGLRALLGSHETFEVVGETSIEEPLLFPGGVDVLVLAGEHTVTHPALWKVLKSLESPAVLLLTEGNELPASLLNGLDLRAWGALPLDCTEEELTAAVFALNEGLLVGSPALLKSLLLPPASGGADKILSMDEVTSEPLTAREIEVLRLLAQGLANKQIALALGISEHTVKFHIASIYTKLGVNSRTEAVRAGVRHGLVVL
jgi:DNA-binding NarL/FixJ family response regulator